MSNPIEYIPCQCEHCERNRAITKDIIAAFPPGTDAIDALHILSSIFTAIIVESGNHSISQQNLINGFTQFCDMENIYHENSPRNPKITEWILTAIAANNARKNPCSLQ